MTRTFGNRYGELREQESAADIAKRIRSDIKTAIADGELPGGTRNYSVRTSHYANGRSIYLGARNLEGLWQDCDGTEPTPHGVDYCPLHGLYDPWIYEPGQEDEFQRHPSHRVLTAEGRRVEELLQAMWDAYNYDCDSVSDVNYYGRAEVTDPYWSRDPYDALTEGS